MIHGIEGRGDVVQGTVGISLLHTEFLDIEAIVHLEVVAHMTHVQRIEPRLGISQGRLHLRRLKHLRGMIGRDTQRLSAVNDILAQSESKRGDTLLCRLLADGVIVQRTEHT